MVLAKLGGKVLTSKFRFVLRKEAAKIAFDAGQIDKYENDQIIFSEDFWCEGHRGKHKYDSKMGYYIEVDCTDKVAKVLEETEENGG